MMKKTNCNFFFIAVISVLLCSCSQSWYQRRDIKKLVALSIKQPTEFLRLSDLINPCFTGKAKSDTIKTKGKPDTVVLPGEIKVMITMQHDTVVKTITLPGKQVTIPYFTTIHDTIPDTRAIASLQAQLNQCGTEQTTATTQLADAKKTSNRWMWIAIGCMALIVITVVVKVYSFFSGGGLVSAAKKII